MELDNTTILYIVFAIGYFVFTNFIKKKKAAQNGPPSDRPEDATETLGPPPGRRPSFEELLEEFTTGKPAQREAPIEVIPEKQEVQIAAPSASFVKRKSILESHTHSVIKPDMERFGRFDDVPETTSKFTDVLKEPDGPQKAFVLSEIFKKKF
tara:strand:- start:135 stop:593 length:459 start_codon:yes stop_codon:yes gene_type:complete